MTSLAIDDYPIPYLCPEQVWVWVALVHYSFALLSPIQSVVQHLSESDQRRQLCTSSKNTSALFPLAALAFVNTLHSLNSESLPYNHILSLKSTAQLSKSVSVQKVYGPLHLSQWKSSQTYFQCVTFTGLADRPNHNQAMFTWL